MKSSAVASAKRILIVGLDGVTWDVLRPLMTQGLMPRLRRVCEEGASGVLRSTTPPITPAAWTTFLTGKQPGKHGIIDFERYDVHTNKLAFNSTRCLDHVPNLWKILGDRGFKIGSVNVPMTFPPVPVNGFLVSGFETPGPHANFVYPPELRDEILERWPDPTLRANWRHSVFFRKKAYRDNIDYIQRSFSQGAEMTRCLGDRLGWDVLMVVFKLTDNLQHKTWKYLDPRWAGRDPYRTELAKACFEQADRALGRLMEYAESRDAATLIVSDHGHGSLEGKIHVNRLLEQWGYLVLKSGGAQGSTRARYVWDRLRGKTRRFARAGDVLHDLAVDFTQTRACVMHAGMAGFLYFNLKGRQPGGIVDADDYERLRDEIRHRLLSEECTVRGDGRTIRLFQEVHKPEELYGCPRAEQPWMPDLILIPYESLAVVRKIRGAKVVHWLSYDRIEGTHRPDGILAAAGPGIGRTPAIKAHIVDCAPTILAMLGQPIPTDMDGRVITELFASPPKVALTQVEAPLATVPSPGSENAQAYSEDQVRVLTARLSDLGYLE